MPNQPKAGRPRRTLDWASTLRYNLPVSFAKDRDIHTALFLAGTGAIDMVMHAIREYITNHPEQTGYAIDPVVQQRVAAKALAIAMGVDGAQIIAPPVPTVQMWVAPSRDPESVPAETNRATPDDMVSRLRSAIPASRELAAPSPQTSSTPVNRVGLESDFNFPDENAGSLVDEEARRLGAAHQFAVSQLKDA